MDHIARFQMNGLRALSALSRYGTLSKAASHLCVSPGAISKQVVRIEEQLGHRVFDRTSDGFVPVQDYHGFTRGTVRRI
ncbi:helix-turn-helix domain-containing protein [Roseobacter weihaiensis]|uniref:helix-turn-helix domain-containing protein n=1 Tax=Roseobacter weihaiensis TaxID=2763262 RepID=UPI001D0B79EC|nr:LysR family transcriptional regulator [Roseobacter sp. H9]